MGMRIGACVLVLLLTASGAFGQERHGRDGPITIRTGNWAGGAIFENGKFRECNAEAPNSAGTMLRVVALEGYYGDEPFWFIELSQKSWRLEVGTAFPVDLGFDGQALFHSYGKPLDEHNLSVPISGDAIVRRFFQSRAMYTFVQGQQYSLALDGVSRLQPLLVQCLRTNSAPTAGRSSVAPTGSGFARERLTSEYSRLDGGWKARANFDAKGALAACTAVNSFNNNGVVGVAMQTDRSWGVYLSRPSWHWEVGKPISVDVTFDSQAQYHLFAKPLSEDEHGLIIPMEGDGLVEQFRRSKVMWVFFEGQSIPLILGGTSRLFPVLAECVRANTTANAR